ncbi:ubp1-associated protein 2a [Quercus suber]|uniref:Ubp1-associated protein 2a n=1 Tax=Quercus suber TaxID=58331 RepID=A0AAW0LAT6_QUESU
MPRFSSIFLPFLINQTQKHKHKLISSKNKNTNTNPATDFPCQPNTEAANKNPATDDDEDEDVEKLLEPFTKDHFMALIKKGVKKHPDLIEIVRELANADPPTVRSSSTASAGTPPLKPSPPSSASTGDQGLQGDHRPRL